MSSIRLYGCGGLGANIVSFFDREMDEPNVAEFQIAYVDTSRSNIQPHFDESKISVLEGMDGSGKLRKENADAIHENIRKILLDHPPGDFNVVVFSASGGSGSVIAPLIVRELLSNRIPVVAITAGFEESLISAQNTLNTLKTLEAISDQVKQPVAVFYRHQDAKTVRSAIDDELRLAISYLSVLVSGKNAELDRMDILNWLFYHRVTSISPTLVGLEFANNPEILSQFDKSTVVTVASIYANYDHTALPIIPEYQCSGYSRHLSDGLNIQSMHFILDTGIIRAEFESLKQILDGHINFRSARVAHKSVVESTDTVQKNGLVL